MSELMLEGYRAIDLTDEKGFLCGMLLADQGCDVIKVEKPGGDRSRNIGPFYHDEFDPEKSLNWMAYNLGKRGITLDIETADGKEILKQLVKTADFVIESFPVGYLDSIGLGYDALSKINKKIILTSITDFGLTGPYKDWKGSELVCTALAGFLYLTGDPDRAPVQCSFPNTYNFAGVEAAIGTLLALHQRHLTDEGQHVDVSAQRAIIPTTFESAPWWNTFKEIYPRQGTSRTQRDTGVIQRGSFPCKDGYVALTGGPRSYQALFDWMKSINDTPEALKGRDWSKFKYDSATQQELDEINNAIIQFLLRHTKSEVYDELLKKRGIPIGPFRNAKDMLEATQLKERGYWVSIRHDELNDTVTYPGQFVKSSLIPYKTPRRAPLIGEHNKEVFRELNISSEQLLTLKQSKVI